MRREEPFERKVKQSPPRCNRSSRLTFGKHRLNLDCSKLVISSCHLNALERCQRLQTRVANRGAVPDRCEVYHHSPC